MAASAVSHVWHFCHVTTLKDKTLSNAPFVFLFSVPHHFDELQGRCVSGKRRPLLFCLTYKTLRSFNVAHRPLGLTLQPVASHFRPAAGTADYQGSTKIRRYAAAFVSPLCLRQKHICTCLYLRFILCRCSSSPPCDPRAKSNGGVD